jgi:hypothetical protein
MVLIEPEVRHIIQAKLRECHEVRIGFYSRIFNIVLFITMVFGIALFVYLKWKYRPTDEQRKEKMKREQEYILSQIRFYQEQQRNASTTNITKLPVLTLK